MVGRLMCKKSRFTRWITGQCDYDRSCIPLIIIFAKAFRLFLHCPNPWAWYWTCLYHNFVFSLSSAWKKDVACNYFCHISWDNIGKWVDFGLFSLLMFYFTFKYKYEYLCIWNAGSRYSTPSWLLSLFIKRIKQSKHG